MRKQPNSLFFRARKRLGFLDFRQKLCSAFVACSATANDHAKSSQNVITLYPPSNNKRDGVLAWSVGYVKYLTTATSACSPFTMGSFVLEFLSGLDTIDFGPQNGRPLSASKSTESLCTGLCIVRGVMEYSNRFLVGRTRMAIGNRGGRNASCIFIIILVRRLLGWVRVHGR